MSRPIEFRIWNGEEIIYYDDTYRTQYQLLLNGNVNVHETGCDEKCILMQFTGSLDRNGVKIFEGDVVFTIRTNYFYDRKTKSNIKIEEKQEPFSIKWIDELYSGGCCDHGQVTTGFDFREWCSNELEVIGNIYENPELIPT